MQKYARIDSKLCFGNESSFYRIDNVVSDIKQTLVWGEKENSFAQELWGKRDWTAKAAEW